MADWLINYGSWCLAPFGLLGMYVVGRKKTWGWVLSMTTQSLWAVYAIGTGQYGFLIGTASYFVIYLRNWIKWRREDRVPSSVADISRDSRLEMTNIATLADASKAVTRIFDLGGFTDSEFHAYLHAGTGLTFWVRDPYRKEGS